MKTIRIEGAPAFLVIGFVVAMDIVGLSVTISATVVALDGVIS